MAALLVLYVALVFIEKHTVTRRGEFGCTYQPLVDSANLERKFLFNSVLR